MLAIAPDTLDALRVAHWPAFVERVRLNLVASYPHFLPCFPEPVQTRIVGHMLERARGRGFAQQASLYAFCELMVEVAPNFDDVPEIGRVIDDLASAKDLRFPDIAHQLPPHLRQRARAGSSALPLFVPAAERDAPAEQRNALAIGLALGDRPEAARAPAAAAAATAQAKAMGLAAREDAPLVIAACRSFWGPDFARLSWAAAIAHEGWSAPETLALYRLRLALDLGRFV